MTMTQVNETTGSTDQIAALPHERLERVWAWGGASSSMGYVFRPTTLEHLRDVFDLAQQTGRSVGLKGGGNSYGDAFMNSENIVLDLSRMNRILDWNPETGVVTAEPGVSIEKLWQYILEDGWWPPVVTGTMKTTLGGCAGMNVHGKNAWQVGPIGNHILQFDLMLPSGEIKTCSREVNSDIFYAAIGGFGMLGCFTSLTLQMKRIYSGYLQVKTGAPANLDGMFEFFEQNLEKSNYIVGWVDAFGKGDALGRGDAHIANYLPSGADPNPQQSLRLEHQDLPDTIVGVVPKSIMWMFMRPFMNNMGTSLVNLGKYVSGRVGSGREYLQTHAAFHFLLDYVPNWKKSYGSGGLIQYQPFIPKENAREAFAEILRTCQKHDLPNYLTVFKRHRPDDFLLTHGLDGFSMAMDFLITDSRRPQIAALARELDAIVLAANGRFY
ncbi:MAG: FAD-binding oxidoreductase, partial [Chloroflexota bacterium]